MKNLALFVFLELLLLALLVASTYNLVEVKDEDPDIKRNSQVRYGILLMFIVMYMISTGLLTQTNPVVSAFVVLVPIGVVITLLATKTFKVNKP